MSTRVAKLSEKISFGFGAVAYCSEWVLVLTYLMLYCSDVLKLNVALFGTVISMVRILDAISDIIITSLADRTNTRFGKYRVWILSGIPLGILLFLVFSNPPFLQSDTARLIWVCVTYCLMVPVMETAFNCPYMALIVTMSESSRDRLDFTIARSIGETGSQIIVSAVTMPIVLSFGGYRNPMGWRVMALVIATVVIISSVICFLGVRERIHVDYTQDSGHQLSLGKKLAPLKGNGPFWKLFSIIVFFMAHSYASSAVFAYFCIHNLKHEDWLAPLTAIGYATQILVVFVLLAVGTRMEKRTLLLFGAVPIIAADAILLMAASFAMGVAYEIFLSVGNAIYNCMAFAMLPDVTDYTEYKTGLALPGMISAIATFAMKLSGAVTTWLVSRMLIFARYDAELLTQTAFTQQVLRVSLPVFSGACMVIVLILVFSLSKLSLTEIDAYRKAINMRQNSG